MFEEKCTELILRIILERADIKVMEVHTQREIKNLRSHSVRLDIGAKSMNVEPVDVEIQRADKGAGVKRKTLNTKIRLQPIKNAFSMSLPISNIGVGIRVCRKKYEKKCCPWLDTYLSGSPIT